MPIRTRAGKIFRSTPGQQRHDRRGQGAGYEATLLGRALDCHCQRVRNVHGGPEPWWQLTGVRLFVGGVGRPDVTRADHEIADRVFDARQHMPMTLPERFEFLPGHQAGTARGTGLSGKPSSTLGL